MKKIILLLVVFLPLPLLTSAQLQRPILAPPTMILPSAVTVVGATRPASTQHPNGAVAQRLFGINGKPLLSGVITGPAGSDTTAKAKDNDLLVLYDSGKKDTLTGKPIMAVGNYSDLFPKHFQSLKCRLNKPWENIIIEKALHTAGQVWICPYIDARGVEQNILIPQYSSDDTLKLAFYDLKITGGGGMFFDPKTNTIIPAPASTVFHMGVLARAINKGDVLFRDDTPLAPKELGLERKGGEPWMTFDADKLGVNVASLPLGVMTPDTKPIVGANGISATILQPQQPTAGSPTAGAVPDSGGFVGGSKPPLTPQTLSDVFQGNILFSGGFSLFFNIVTLNWRYGPPEPMVSDDGKGLIFFKGFSGVPFAVIITDTNKDHVYEAHRILYKFPDSEAKKPENLRDWSTILFVKEFKTEKEYIDHVNSLPKKIRY